MKNESLDPDNGIELPKLDVEEGKFLIVYTREFMAYL